MKGHKMVDWWDYKKVVDLERTMVYRLVVWKDLLWVVYLVFL